jgi:ABC-type nitrate/sulfonate/bicarbonate transport system substrate-binding protein
MTASMLLPRRNKSDFAMLVATQSVRVPSISGGWRCTRHHCASAGAKFVYAACMPASQRGLLVLERSVLRSLADIKGKKIAFARRTSAQNLMLRPLAKADFTYGDIVPIYLSPADASAALSRGDVDAWVVWDPF